MSMVSVRIVDDLSESFGGLDFSFMFVAIRRPIPDSKWSMSTFLLVGGFFVCFGCAFNSRHFPLSKVDLYEVNVKVKDVADEKSNNMRVRYFMMTRSRIERGDVCVVVVGGCVRRWMARIDPEFS
jgi:hypothetical protein